MMTSSTSLSRQRYLAQIRRRRRLITATRWGLLLALFALWEAGAQLGLINDFLLSSPSRMVRTAVSLIQSGELFLHIGTTLFETLAGFAISAILGTALAVLLWWSALVAL